MRIAAIVLNIVLFVLAVYLLLTQGFPTGGYFFVWLIIAGCPVVNLITLLTSGKECNHFLGLYFKRRRLEEEKRIEALKKGEQ
jgi:hypothetical protein